MALSKFNITVKNSQPWLHATVAVDDILRGQLLKVFHKDCEFLSEPAHHVKFSRDPTDLYKELDLPNLRKKLENLRKNNVIYDDQWELLFPASKQTDSNKFDITLLVVLIKNLNNIKTLNGKWKKDDLDPNDHTILAYVIKALVLRNSLYHFGSITSIATAQATVFWKTLTTIAAGLKYQGDINQYKTLSLDPDAKVTIDKFVQLFQSQIDQLKQQQKFDLDVAKLETENKINEFEKRMKDLRCLVNGFHLDKVNEKISDLTADLHAEMRKVYTLVTNLEEDMVVVKEHVGVVREEIVVVKEDMETVKEDIQMIKCDTNANVKLTASLQEGTCGDYRYSQLSERLRDQTKEQLEIWKQKEPIKTNGVTKYRTEKRQDAFVELIVGGWEEACDMDLEHYQRRNLTKTSKLERNKIVEPLDQCILVRGIAGIGKTSLLKSLVYDWSVKILLNDYDFVIKLECRDLNCMGNLNGWFDILVWRYKKLFKEQVLQNLLGKKILIIIDGIDELVYLDDLKKLTEGKTIENSPANALYELLNPNVPCWNLTKTILISGRPNACEKLVPGLQELFLRCKLVEITGFNDEGINEFIRKFNFEDSRSAKSLQDTLNENQRIKTFMCIPVYAYTICSVYNCRKGKEQDLINQLNTFTKLNLTLFLVHLRDLMQRTHESFVEFLKEQELAGVIQELAEFAYKSLRQRRIIFQEEELSKCKYLTGIEKSGIMVKYENGEDGYVYQFVHLIFQEFLCAIHIYRKIELDLVINHSIMKNVLLFYCGLLGLHENSKSPKYMTQFISVIQTDKVMTEESKSSELCDIICYKVDNARLLLIYEFNKPLEYKVRSYCINKEFSFYLNFKSEFYRALHFIKLTELKSLSLYFHKFNPSLQDFMEMVATFSSQYYSNCGKPDLLKELDMSGCNIDDDSIKVLSPLLPSAKRVRFCYETITSAGWEILIKYVMDSHRQNKLLLKELDISYGNISDKSMMILSPMFTILEWVYLRSNKRITSAGWKMLTKCVIDLHGKGKLLLKKLDINNCNLYDDSIEVLSPMLPLLEDITLFGNYLITITGWEILTQCVIELYDKGEMLLKKLDISSCRINDDNIALLSLFLPLVKEVDLSRNNDITGAGWEKFTKCVIDSHCKGELLLKKLSIRYCSINDDSIVILSPLLSLMEIKT